MQAKLSFGKQRRSQMVARSDDRGVGDKVLKVARRLLNEEKTAP